MSPEAPLTPSTYKERSSIRGRIHPLLVLGFALGLSGCQSLAHLSDGDDGAGNGGGDGDGDFSPSNPLFSGGTGGTDQVAPGSGGALPGSGGNSGAGGTATATGGAGGGTTIGDRGPGTPILPNGRGPSVHFVTYEAEEGNTNGQVLGPTRHLNQVAGEASGRRAVRLDAQGEFVSFQTEAQSNSIVVRYSIPDGGHNFWSTLSVFVNGEFRTTLPVTSRYSWTYGDEYAFNNPSIHENPGSGHPHHFFDETRGLIGDVPQGATISVQKGASDGAGHYDIDFIELEQVPPPLPKPENAFSITSCGATPNDNTDDSDAIQQCIEAAQNTGMAVYIPEGTFRSLSAPLSVPGLTITGAGMWHSVISGFHARFDCYQPGCTFRDFAILGDTVQRVDDSPETAFGGQGSSGVTVERVWVEHTKTGYWTGANTNGLTIRGSRFRNLMADGVNLWGGAQNSVVEECHFRNTGDDAIASWSDGGYPTNQNNRFSHNYVQIPWKANCFALYGGANNTIEDNVCADTVQYPGILLSRAFGSHAFSGTSRVERNTLIRAGGWIYDKGHGAIKFHAQEGPVQGIEVNDVEIIDASYHAFHVEGPHLIDSVWLNGAQVSSPGQEVFLLDYGSHGALDAAGIVATGAPGGVENHTGSAFDIKYGSGNSGWSE